jgi:hypothetical protein
MDQLDGHVDFVAGSLDRAFEDAVDAKRFRDFPQRAMRSLVLHGGGSRDDAEGGILCQHGGQFIGHTIGEVLLATVAGEVVEWKYRQGSDPEFCVASPTARAQTDADDEQSKNGRCCPPQQRTGFAGGRRGRFSERRLNHFGLYLRLLSFWLLYFRDRSDETIALTHHGLNEARFLRIVAKHLTDFADGGIDAMLGVDEDLRTPKALSNLGAGDKVAVPGGKENQQLHRLAFQLQPASGTVKLEAA